ncbi:hypothetical protein [Bythopirellula goksoeyrii]|uniref:Uncharacterized protein n=1 Tax=Bythopirellula goksoeyrii TaxID=1400387 RepID=A0A5B9Q2R1_9BACT|nr:hypothetical protein [Bythopirellula goksoeyrii]QEG33308.1 hypothetical protein Pr1d_05690 [Bythopirellula goksoeyrii]
MRIFGFTFKIDPFVNDNDAINAFYGKCDDASVAGSGGKTLIHFDREADSLDDALRRDDALRSAVAEVQGEGWQVREITVEPDCLAPMTSS